MTLPHAYVICGMHGGYFLTNRDDFDEALGYTERFLAADPGLNYSVEIEAYTLDRFVRGPQLDVEKRFYNWRRRDYPDVWIAPDLAARLRDLAQRGRIDNVSTYTQPILHALDGEAVVRQFGYARRIQREVLGIEFEHYAAQEPCWCGQLPAILTGFNMKGCIFETSWGPFGFAPLRNGESFRWRGPDGSEIPAVPASPGTRDPRLERDKETQRHWMPWQNPMYEKLNGPAIQEALDQGLDNPSVVCLSLDFTSDNPEEWFNTRHIVHDDCEITFTTLGPYLEVARDDGIWEDAFADFEDRMCWGRGGGQLYLDSQVAANTTILAQRLSVLLGFDCRDQEDRMWQATMVSHHHDAWLAPSYMFGQWDYDSYYDLIVASRKEVEQRAGALFPAPEGPAFSVTNPTQHDRREWVPVDLTLTEGAASGEIAILDSAGAPVPSRVRAMHHHADGSVARAAGTMLANVAGFDSATYTVAAGDRRADIPTRVTATGDGWEIANDTLKAVLSPDGITLYRGGIECVSDLRLHAQLDGCSCHSKVQDVEAVLEPSGVAYACAKIVVGYIPIEMELRLRPWSDRFDLHVRCDYDGERTEGTSYWEQDGNLKLIAAYSRPVSHRLHHPLELRAPTERTHSAVHFVLADAEDGSGCALILDRPSGVVAGEESTGITLCHSGWTACSPSPRPGVKVVDGNLLCGQRAYGMQEYDIGLLPYAPDGVAAAACAYQDQAYPLQITAGPSGPLPVPNIHVEGHSIVSNLSREEGGIVLRLWNPLEQETVTVKAPGMPLILTDLEGGELESLGSDEASFSMRPMQIRTVLLQSCGAPPRGAADSP